MAAEQIGPHGKSLQKEPLTDDLCSSLHEESLDRIEVVGDRRRRQGRQKPPAVAHGPEARDRGSPARRGRSGGGSAARAPAAAPGSPAAPGSRRTHRRRAPLMASIRAAVTGSPGEANGSLSMITQLSASPTTSTPCQKLDVASSTAFGVRPELVDQRRTRRRALHEDRVGQRHLDERLHRAQHRVAGEEHERAAARALAAARWSRAPPPRRSRAPSAAACGAAGRAAPGARSRTRTARAPPRRRGCRAGPSRSRTSRPRPASPT